MIDVNKIFKTENEQWDRTYPECLSIDDDRGNLKIGTYL